MCSSDMDAQNELWAAKLDEAGRKLTQLSAELEAKEITLEVCLGLIAPLSSHDFCSIRERTTAPCKHAQHIQGSTH